jgi:hypothetical protein
MTMFEEMEPAFPTSEPPNDPTPKEPEETVEATYSEVEVTEPRALVPAAPATDHVIVGLGMLAKMDDAEFTAKLEMLKKGRDRVAEIQRSLMVEGVDFGKVPGIDRPFLHLPGAEALEKFYGFASEQRTTRILGDGVSTPPYAYRSDTLIHLGDLSGPVVASVSASCNPWESRYRYVNRSPTCPKCGREGLIRRKSPPPMAGKWNCPSWNNQGGCNAIFEPNDPTIEAGGKVENPDPWSLDETIIQIAQKRSYVAGIRRATGTSGLFTIDEDSPSVQQQSAAADVPSPSAPPDVKAGPEGVEVARGGKPELVTMQQISELSTLSKMNDMGPEGMARVVERVTGVPIDLGDETDRQVQSTIVVAALQRMKADDFGRVLHAIKTGEVPESTPEAE